MTAKNNRHTARITRFVRLAGSCMAYATDTETSEIVAFTLDKVNGYRGQSLKAFGLSEGKEVTYTSTQDSIVTSVDLG